MIVKKICNLISYLVLVVLLAVAAVIALPLLLGYKELAVLTGSMEPNVPVGSMEYIKQVDAAELQPGDICTYYLSDGETFVTHRVVSVDAENSTLITQGDANENPDGPVSFDRVYGRVDFHVPWVGYCASNIKTPKGIMAICGVLLVVLLVNFIPAIIDADEEEKAKKQAEKPPAQSE